MKKISLLIILILFIFNLFGQRNTGQRKINHDWKFHLGDLDRARESTFDDFSWRTLPLPHDWSIEQAFSQENSRRNAWLPGGIGWYRKNFDLTVEEASKYVEIQFDGIYRHSELWINGEYVGVQYDGYTSFYFDISDYVKAGKNVIAVRVDNSVQPNCRWYTGSGIYRDVWLRITDELHVENWGTAITTPVITNSEARVKIKTTITNFREPGLAFSLETIIIGPDGNQVASLSETTHYVSKKFQINLEQELSVFNPLIWTLEKPHLYKVQIKVIYNGNVVDEYWNSFGIREVKFDPKKGFFLNGENMKLKGVCLHHEAGTLGAAVPNEVWERRLKKLKETGCNAIRTAHNPMSPGFIDLCDELGFLVMNEFVDKWDHPTFAEPHFHQEWKKNFRNTIRRDRNHPSVIIWSVGNENHTPGSYKQTSSLKEYCDYVRSIDLTRPVVSGMKRGKDKDPDEKVDGILESAQHMDIIAVNYGEQWVKRIAHRNPGKCFVSTESNSYYGSTENERWSLTERSPWFDVLENDFNIGQFLWVGIEYMGEIKEQGPDGWPEIFCWPSAFLTSAGFRTPLSHQFEALWNEKPMVWIGIYDRETYKNQYWGSPAFREDWNLEKGKNYDLVSYTNCDFVDLYVNNIRIGRQKLSDFSNWIMNWYDIAFEEGEVKAVGIIDGKEACEYLITTAGKPNTVTLTSDKDIIRHGEIVQIEVQLIDKNSNHVRHIDVDLTFEINGGEILGLDNGALNALDDMKEKSVRSTHMGKCLAIIRANENSKKLELTVKAKGLKTQNMVIDFKN